MQFIATMLSRYDQYWQYKTEKRWGRMRFRSYTRKRSCMDKFFSTFRTKGQSAPLVLYGDGDFPSTGRGERSVPNKRWAKTCSRFHKTRFINEFRTTRVCSVCNSILHRVQFEKISKFPVRGLRWCSSTICRNTFVSRDLNAALNILRCFPSSSRPEFLSSKSTLNLPNPERLRIKRDKAAVEE
jgi:hypothetical protein